MQFDFNCKKTHIQLLNCSEMNNFANNSPIQLLLFTTYYYLYQKEGGSNT